MSHTLPRGQRLATSTLPPAGKVVLRQLERAMARRLAVETDLPFDQALAGVTALHRAGALRLVTRSGQLALAPNRRKLAEVRS
jgi:hypothetical protein